MHFLFILLQSILHKLMKKTISIIDNDLQKNMSEFSKSIIFTQGDSMKSISDCTTVLSQIDFMEENSQTYFNQDLETSFKKQLTNSYNENISCNPNIKKSKILIVESRIIPQQKASSKNKQLKTELDELYNIEKKTQDLVLKEKQQRKELKKMKKLYVEKLDELMKQQEAHLLQENNFNHQIKQLKNQKSQLKIQKEAIQQTMKALEVEVEKTKQEIGCIKVQKQHLTHKIQLLETNFETKEEVISDDISLFPSQNSVDIDRQIEIINRSIKKIQKQENKSELNRLLQMKIELLEKRQIAKVEEERQRHKKSVSNLNQIILSRNNLIKSKNYSILELQKTKKKEFNTYESKEQEKQLQTADSFFKKTNTGNFDNIQINQQNDEQLHLWDEFKTNVRDLIDSNRILGHQQSYEAIESIVLGMIHLFENQECCEEDVLKLLDIGLENLNNKYVSKARKQINKMENLLSFMNKNQKKKFYYHEVRQRQKENRQIISRK